MNLVCVKAVRENSEGRLHKTVACWRFLFYFPFLCLFSACSPESKTAYADQDVPIAWGEMTLYITKHTPGNSPTYASREFGYTGLTMYESIVHGSPGYRSLAGQLNGLDSLPQPEAGQRYNWLLSLNAGQAAILKALYNQTSDENKALIDSLENEIEVFYREQAADDQVAERSIAYGRSVADAVFEWSKTDGGHRGYLHNFDKNMVHPSGPGSWKPPLYSQSFSHFPLHPHWGENRTFVKANSELPIPYMIPYDTTAGSPYYQQFMAVYEMDKSLTQEQKETAIWWGDDPDVTFTPPGHSYYLATEALKIKRPELIVCAEAYARVGMSVADAFIECWKWKYHFFSERANTYIPRFIDPTWVSFWPDPPFPAFPSGHAIQASSAATALASVLGEEIEITDRAHEGRPRDEVRDVDFTIRSFHAFWEIAQETADSRFYGGIHTPQDNQVGLDQGKVIAGNVIGLKWRD